MNTLHYRAAAARPMQVLLARGADVNAVTKLRGSPLHTAAQRGTGQAVQALLEG